MPPPNALATGEEISYPFKVCLICIWVFQYQSVWDDGMMFFAQGKQLASLLSLDSCSLTVSLCLFSSDFISACILMIPGVMISPGLLFDVAEDMLDKVLK